MEISRETREAAGLPYVLGLLSPRSPYGAQRVRALRFYAPGERAVLEAEWDNIDAALAGLSAHPAQYAQIDHLLGQVRDIRGTLRRCAHSALTEVELFEVKRFLLQLGALTALFTPIGGAYRGIAFTDEPGALRLLDPDGRRLSGFSLCAVHSGAAAARDAKARVEADLRAATGQARDALLAHRRTLAALEEEEGRKACESLSEALRPYLDALLANTEALGALDFTLQKALLAKSHGAVRPTVSDGGARFVDLIHPQIADALAARGAAFTPVSLTAPVGVTVITGANMGGKSVALRTLLLGALLCQAGFFAFARQVHMPLFDAVTHIGGDLADAAGGLSSFGAEVLRIQGAIEAASGGALSLMLLDEPARGTNPREGAALAGALAKRLSALPGISVIATHYDGVATHAQARYQSSGLRALPATLPAGDRLAFLAAHMGYGLVPVEDGAQAPREALTVCKLLGLDPAVTREMARALEDGEQTRG